MKKEWIVVFIFIVLALLLGYFIFSDQEILDQKVLEPTVVEESFSSPDLDTKEKNDTVEIKQESNISKNSIKNIDFSDLEIPQVKPDLLSKEVLKVPSSQDQTVQLMKEYQELKKFEKKKNNLQINDKPSEEEWKVDYSVGLEEGSIEQVKEGNLKADMLNANIGFQKSF